MKGIKFSFLLLLGMVIFSCKKNDTTQITYPFVYHKSGLKIVSDLRLFSSNGEIRDPELISRFNQQDSSQFTLYANAIGDDHFRMDSVFLQDPQHAVIKDYNVLKNCIITQAGSILTLTTVDTSIGYSSGDEFTSTPGYYIGRIKPEVYTEYLISSTRGAYSFGFTGREIFVFDRLGGQLAAPIILFIHRKQLQQNMSFVNNILQEDFYKKMAVGDTLSLKKYLVLYEK